MNSYLKSIFKFVSTFICLVIMFNAMLYLSCSFPSEWIEEHIIESADIIKEQGDFVSRGFLAVVENATDGLQVNQLYSVDSNDPVSSYLLVRKNYKIGQTKVVLPDPQGTLLTFSENNFDEDGNPQHDEGMVRKYEHYDIYSNYKIPDELYNFVHGKVNIGQTYSRYYHGHLTIFRPLFLLFNVSGARNCMSVILIGIFIFTVFLLNKKLGFRFAFVFSILIIVFGYFSASQSMQQSPLLLTIMVSLMILLLNIEKYDKEKFMYHIFVTGCFSAFYDYLTVPVLSLALPLLVFYAYNIKNNVANIELNNFWKVFWDLVKIGISWSIGMGCMWLTKVIIVELVYKTNNIWLGISQVLYRSGGEIPYFEFFVIKGAIPHFFKTTAMGIGVFALTTVLIDRIKFFKANKKDWQKNISLILIGCIPLAWFIIFYNHSLFHYTLFTYRNIVVLMMAVFYTITLDKKELDGNKKKNR